MKQRFYFKHLGFTAKLEIPSKKSKKSFARETGKIPGNGREFPGNFLGSVVFVFFKKKRTFIRKHNGFEGIFVTKKWK